MTTPPPPMPSNNSPDPGLPAWARAPRNKGEVPEAQLAQYIGPRWEQSYRRKLAVFQADASFVPTWNWAAMIFTSFWFLYRKLYLAFAVFMIVPAVAFNLLTRSDVQITMANLQQPENEWLAAMYFAVQASSMIAAGGTANWFLFRRARAATRLAQLQKLPAEEASRLIGRIGGVNRGATLLLLALTIMGLVASMRA